MYKHIKNVKPTATYTKVVYEASSGIQRFSHSQLPGLKLKHFQAVLACLVEETTCLDHLYLELAALALATKN